MRPSYATFTAFRRLALNVFRVDSRNLQKWNRPATRLLHQSQTRKLRSSIPCTQERLVPSEEGAMETEEILPEKSYYLISFICKPCKTRSTHKVTKVGYHRGSVLITCPECKNRHIISDHLKIFSDKALTIEDLMREQGQLVKRGTLSEDGNLEFWADNPPKNNTRPKTGAEKSIKSGLDIKPQNES